MSPRYGMVVDLNRCVGCQTCSIACKHANDTPPGVQWRRVLDVERGTYPDVERLFLVTGCQHCAEPPCVPVCPTGATRQRADGLVTMDYDTCIGCGYCAVACPYQARTIAHDTSWYYGEPTAQEAHVAHEERAGVANKCTFCVERVDEGTALGKVPGADLEYTPACAASCIAQALHFGDFADPDSNVSRLARDNASFQMHAELGTDPQIRYLYDVPNATPGREAEAEDTGDAAMANPENPLAGERQTFWDARAAMNFTLGGLAGGTMAVAGLAAAFGMLGAEALVGRLPRRRRADGAGALLRLSRDRPQAALPLRAAASANLLDDARDLCGRGALPGARPRRAMAASRPSTPPWRSPARHFSTARRESSSPERGFRHGGCRWFRG